MRLFAILSHDLNSRDASYEAVKKKLAAMGMFDAMTANDGRLLQLTGNVFVGKYDENKWNPLSLRVAIMGAVEQIYKECGVKGRIFVRHGINPKFRS